MCIHYWPKPILLLTLSSSQSTLITIQLNTEASVIGAKGYALLLKHEISFQE